MRSTGLVVCVVASLLGGSGTAVGQIVRGTLLDDTSRPVAGATITLLNAAGASLAATLTSQEGSWELRAPVLGASYTLRAQKAGYAIVETLPFTVGSRVVVANLRTRVQVTVLEGVSVEGANLAGFLGREERRMGQLLGPEEVARRIAKIQPESVSRFITVLVPGLEVSARGAPLLPRRASGGRRCNPTIVVDRKRYDPPSSALGTRLRPPWDIEDLVSVDQLAAVEIYGDPNFVPLELGLLNLQPLPNPCGVMVIWTKRGLGLQ
jgi:hypothetical protein